jgi:hypothetical protein
MRSTTCRARLMSPTALIVTEEPSGAGAGVGVAVNAATVGDGTTVVVALAAAVAVRTTAGDAAVAGTDVASGAPTFFAQPALTNSRAIRIRRRVRITTHP